MAVSEISAGSPSQARGTIGYCFATASAERALKASANLLFAELSSSIFSRLASVLFKASAKADKSQVPARFLCESIALRRFFLESLPQLAKLFFFSSEAFGKRRAFAINVSATALIFLIEFRATCNPGKQTADDEADDEHRRGTKFPYFNSIRALLIVGLVG
jgi:hypothetical protein